MELTSFERGPRFPMGECRVPVGINPPPSGTRQNGTSELLPQNVPASSLLPQARQIPDASLEGVKSPLPRNARTEVRMLGPNAPGRPHSRRFRPCGARTKLHHCCPRNVCWEGCVTSTTLPPSAAGWEGTWATSTAVSISRQRTLEWGRWIL